MSVCQKLLNGEVRLKKKERAGKKIEEPIFLIRYIFYFAVSKPVSRFFYTDTSSGLTLSNRKTIHRLKLKRSFAVDKTSAEYNLGDFNVRTSDATFLMLKLKEQKL